MGSSCFARGNNRNIELIKQYIIENKTNAQVLTLKGNLCQEACSKGPNIQIDEKQYNGVLPENVCDIIRLHIQKQEEEL
jgi:NADH:ubiquinone oxidoreductase subunit E